MITSKCTAAANTTTSLAVRGPRAGPLILEAELKWREPYFWAAGHMTLHIVSTTGDKLQAWPLASRHYVLENSIFSVHVMCWALCWCSILLAGLNFLWHKIVPISPWGSYSLSTDSSHKISRGKWGSFTCLSDSQLAVSALLTWCISESLTFGSLYCFV